MPFGLDKLSPRRSVVAALILACAFLVVSAASSSLARANTATEELVPPGGEEAQEAAAPPAATPTTPAPVPSISPPPAAPVETPEPVKRTATETTGAAASVGRAVVDATAGEARRLSVSPERTSSSLSDGKGEAGDPSLPADVATISASPAEKAQRIAGDPPQHERVARALLPASKENPISRLVETVDSAGTTRVRQLVETGTRQLDAVRSSITETIDLIGGMIELKTQLEHLLAAHPAAATIAASGSAGTPLAGPPSLGTGSRSLTPQDLDRVSLRTSGAGDRLRDTAPLNPKAIAASGSSFLGRGTPGMGQGETALQWRRDGESFGPSPVDQPGDPLPLQAPMPPAGSVEGHGGTSFIPIVALLALLALVAPTTLRRLGREADFRPPIPFVCALERPG
jgi:hypothetical protein